MTRFTDGPCAGTVLHLSRAPMFLRAVIAPNGTVDALDKLDDTPAPDENIYAYIICGEVSSGFVDGRDPKTGKRWGRTFEGAPYRLFEHQPDDATMRDQKKWSAWCHEAAQRHAEKVQGEQ